MSGPVQVTVVRPRASAMDYLGRFVAQVAGLFLTALVVFWAAPATGLWEPTYWQAFAVVLIARAIFPASTSYLFWTKEGSK